MYCYYILFFLLISSSRLLALALLRPIIMLRVSRLQFILPSFLLSLHIMLPFAHLLAICRNIDHLGRRTLESAPRCAINKTMFAPPLWFIAWGVLFHTTGAILGFHVTTKVPFVGDGAMSVFVRVSFYCDLSTILNHVYHLVGIPLRCRKISFLRV